MPAGLDATKLELGPANIYIVVLPKAFLETALGTNRDLRLTARRGGAAGNSISLTIVVAGTNTVLSVSVAGFAITVNSATTGTIASSTADQIIAAINEHPAASGLVTATRKSGQDGSGVTDAVSLTSLAGGSDDGVETNVGFLGDNVALQLTTQASPLTGAQTGTIPQDKVITGGAFRLTIPFKEIKMESYVRAFPNAVLLEDGGGLRRLDYRSQVGASMRALAVEMRIKKIIGGSESADPEQIFVIPEISPVDSDISLSFSPTEQRVLQAQYEAWPDASGRWAFIGDEIL